MRAGQLDRVITIEAPTGIRVVAAKNACALFAT